MHRSFGLLVEYADHVVFGAAIDRLTAHRQHDARHLIDQRHSFVALNQFRLHQVGNAQRPARLQRGAGGEPDRLLAVADQVAADLGARAPLDQHVGALDDLAALERRPRDEIGRDLVGKAEQAVGLAARAPMQPGRPLRVADLMKPELVQRNETVTLVYEVPGITLTVRGKAAERGAEGDVISVLNEQSKRTVQGVVVGPGRVIISTGSPRLAANLPPSR